MTTQTMRLGDGSVVKYRAIKRMVMTPDKISGGRQTAEAELDGKIKLLMRETGRSYSEAMTTVLMLDSELKARWIAETLPRRR